MKTIAILSAIIVVTPFLGIPGSWETSIIVTFGLIIFLKSFYSYRMNRDTSKDFSVSSFKQNDFSRSNEEPQNTENKPDIFTQNKKNTKEGEGFEDEENIPKESENNLFEDEEK